jgi:Tol biopolymer transport system component
LNAEDGDPVYLPSGQTIVFDGRTAGRPDGRTAAKATRNLYTVRTNGTGLKRLTSNGG